MVRVFRFILELVLTVIGFSYILIYLNLLVMGYSVKDYMYYIFSKIECIIFFIGYIAILIELYFRRRKHELHIRRSS